MIFGPNFLQNYVKKIVSEFDEKIKICEKEKGNFIPKLMMKKYKENNQKQKTKIIILKKQKEVKYSESFIMIK